MNFKSLLFLLLFTASGAQASNPASEAHGEHAELTAPSEAPDASIRVISVREIPMDFRIPAKLWDQLLSHTLVKEMQVAEEGREDEAQGSNILFSPLKVRLIEKNPGVLISPVVEFSFPKGGGQIDLSKVTTGQAGTFFVRFELGEVLKDPKFEAFHLSRAKKRRFEDRIFGGGCRNFTKITSILRQAGPQGLPVNTTRDLHLSALGGNFLFSWANADSVSVTQVRFFDSEKPRFSCEAP